MSIVESLGFVRIEGYQLRPTSELENAVSNDHLASRRSTGTAGVGITRGQTYRWFAYRDLVGSEGKGCA